MRIAKLLASRSTTLVLLCFVVSCSNPSVPGVKANPSGEIPATSPIHAVDIAPSTQPFADYDFHLGNADQESLAHQINSLKIGMSKIEVNKIVQFKHDEFSEAFAVQHDSITRWYYIIARHRNGLSSQGADQYVNLFFNDKDQLDDVLSTFPLVHLTAIKNSTSATQQVVPGR